MIDLKCILADIAAADSSRALWHVLLDFFRAHGVTMASYHAINGLDDSIAIATDGFPRDWVETYVENDFVQIDPIPHLAARMTRPFYWHEIRDLAPASPEADHYLDAFEAAGLGDGLAFYVFGPGLKNAYVGLGFGESFVELPEDQVIAFQFVAQAGHLRYLELSAKPATREPLTRREREVLGWVAKGKSNSVIADILSMSPHTVDTHMRSIYRKLGVSDRTSAALRGVGQGLLQYPQ